MRKISASISIILVFTILCGCSGISRPEGFQDVQNIISVDYQFGDFQNFDDHYSFDLERGVFRFTRDANRNSPEYELEQSEIETIRNSIKPTGVWNANYNYQSPGSHLSNHGDWLSYDIVITYADGTSCELKGESSGEKMPKGFDELRSSFDSIVALREFGSFTRDKTYSYDGKYYVAKFDPSFHEIDIYSSNGYVDAIILPNPGDYYGVCWEKDSYNLWIQEENGDILCYNMADEKWFLNENAVKPDYIICRDVV